jgi:hypothetical protein
MAEWLPPESAMVGRGGEGHGGGILAVVCAPEWPCGGNLQAGNRVVFLRLALFGALTRGPRLRSTGARAKGQGMNAATETAIGQSAMHTVGQSAMRKALWRIVPLVALGYLCAYMDRVNVGFAAVRMNADLGFSATVYGLGAGLFFLAGALLEIPSNLMAVRMGSRRWLARIMISWGDVCRHAFRAHADAVLCHAFRAGRGRGGVLAGADLLFRAVVSAQPPGAGGQPVLVASPWPRW